MSGRALGTLVGLILMADPAQAASLAFTPDGKELLLAGRDGTLNIYAPPESSEPIVVRAHQGACHALTVSADGRRVVTAGQDGVARVWDRRTWKEVVTLRGHTKDVYVVALSPDGKLAVTGGADQTARVWDLATGTERLKVDEPAGPALGVCFSGDGRYLFTGTAVPDDSVRGFRGAYRGEPVRRRDAATGKPTDFPPVKGYTFAASRWLVAVGNEHFAAIPDGKGAFSVGAQFAAAVMTPGGKVRATVTHCGTGVTFSPDGLLLAVTESGPGWNPGRIMGPASQTRGLAVVDALDGGELLTEPNDVPAAAFSPDGRRLAVIGAGGRPFRFIDLVPKARAAFAADVDAAWTALADADPKAAHEAGWALVAHGPKAVARIAEQVKPALGPTPAEVAKHIAALNSARFAEREAATKALAEAGPAAAAALREALKAPPSEEARGRIERLLDAAEVGGPPPDPDGRRRARAVSVLERINSPEARDLLAKLASGAPGAWLTEDAAIALGRAKLRAEK